MPPISSSSGDRNYSRRPRYERAAPIADTILVHISNEVAFASQPSESFVEHGLRIKESTWPVRTWVVCYANGMLGYLPHEEAFKRGGYE